VFIHIVYVLSKDKKLPKYNCSLVFLDHLKIEEKILEIIFNFCVLIMQNVFAKMFLLISVHLLILKLLWEYKNIKE